MQPLRSMILKAIQKYRDQKVHIAMSGEKSNVENHISSMVQFCAGISILIYVCPLKRQQVNPSSVISEWGGRRGFYFRHLSNFPQCTSEI